MANILRSPRTYGRHRIIPRSMMYPTARYMCTLDIHNFFRSLWYFIHDVSNYWTVRWINESAFRIVNPERFYQEACPQIWEGCTREYFELILSACQFQLISAEYKDYCNFFFTNRDFGRLKNIKATRPIPCLRLFLQQSKDFHSETSSDQITSISKAFSLNVVLQTSLGPHSDESSTSEESSTKIMSEEEIYSFLKNLWEIISDYQYQYFSIVRWKNEGKIFKIVDYKGFKQEICPMLCEGCTPKYFKYVLDSCGFLNIAPDYVDFSHEDFKDEEFERLKNIKPKTPVRKPKIIPKCIVTSHLVPRSIEGGPNIADIAARTAEQIKALLSTAETIEVLPSSEGNSSSTESIPDQPKSESTLSCPSEGKGTAENQLSNADAPPHKAQDAPAP